MEVGYLFILYYVEMCIFFLTYKILYSEKIERFWLPLVGGVVFLLFWFGGGKENIALAKVIVHMLVIFTIWLVPKVNFRTRFSRTAILLFVVNCVLEMLMTITEAIQKFTPWLNGIGEDAISLVIYVIQLFSFLISLLLKEKLEKQTKKRIKAKAKRSIIYGVIFMALAMLFTISGLQWARGEIENFKFQILSIVLCISSYIGVGLLGVFSMYMENTNKKLEQMRDNEKQLMNMQVRYYDTLLEREADTRKYRHDMNNHLICLKQLVNKNDISAVENYLCQMQMRMDEIQKRCISTGNDILDILTNHYVNILDDSTNIRMEGTIQTSIDPMKLCTIYANLLQNAIEELKRCKGNTELEIIFKQGKEYFQISIKNTLSNLTYEESGNLSLKTVKIDKYNHGIGLNNVKNTVQELGGVLKLYKEKGYFCAEVSLKI